MKKTLVALATLAVAGGAFAQSPNARAIDASGVTIFGVADAALVSRSADNAGTLTSLQGEGRNESTRLGFRGVEDIGGGLAAAFWLEAAYNQDNGTGSTSTSNNSAVGQNSVTTATGASANSTLSLNGASAGGQQGLTFNRAATVSLLSKSLGEIRVGRDYVPAFWNLTVFDPFGTVGSAAATNIYFGTLGNRAAVSPPGNPSPQVRSSNSVGWLSNNMGGFRAQFMLGLSEAYSGCADLAGKGSGLDNNTCIGAAGDGKHIGARLSYASGPLSAAFGYGKTAYDNSAARTASAGVTGYNGDYTHWNLGASYDLGAAKLSYVLSQQSYGNQSVNVSAGTSAQTASTTGQVVTGTFTAVAVTAGSQNIAEAKVNSQMIGLVVPSGAWTYKASYVSGKRTGGLTTNVTTNKNIYEVADGATQTQIGLGIVYDFSKRTAAYATYSALTAKGLNATANNGVSSSPATAGNSVTATGFDLGIRTRF